MSFKVTRLNASEHTKTWHTKSPPCPTRPPLPSPAKNAIYNRVFWTAYLANFLLVTGNSLIFRFADWIKLLGGTNSITGTIVSAGTIGALTARIILGQAIDHYGTRLLWGMTSLAFSVGIFGMVCCSSIGWEMYVFRVIYAIGVAGMFTCSVVHIQNHAPTHRRTEVIGMLGSSGFVGMIAGTQLGDLFIVTLPDAPIRFYWMFGTAVCTGLIYFLLTIVLTHNSKHERPHTTPPMFSLLRRYWPGSVISVAATMGLGFAVTTVFLTRFAAEMDLRGVGTFFGGYAVSAFTVRLISRNWSVTIGRHRMVVMGLLGHAVGTHNPAVHHPGMAFSDSRFAVWIRTCPALSMCGITWLRRISNAIPRHRHDRFAWCDRSRHARDRTGSRLADRRIFVRYDVQHNGRTLCRHGFRLHHDSRILERKCHQRRDTFSRMAMHSRPNPSIANSMQRRRGSLQSITATTSRMAKSSRRLQKQNSPRLRQRSPNDL